jgi:hypothetical protein
MSSPSLENLVKQLGDEFGSDWVDVITAAVAAASSALSLALIIRKMLIRRRKEAEAKGQPKMADVQPIGAKR